MSLLEVPRRLVPPDAMMPAEPPLISCLMLTRGRLVPTRFSIDCYRRQTWPNRELIVVCDDPASELPAYIETLDDPSIRYVLTVPDVIGALRKLNERVILRVIQTHGPLSRADVVRRSGLSAPTVSKAVASLLAFLALVTLALKTAVEWRGARELAQVEDPGVD